MDLIRSVPVEHLVAQREAFVSQMNLAKEAHEKAKALYQASPLGYSNSIPGSGQQPFSMLGGSFASGKDQFPCDVMIKGFDAQAWGYLMDQSGLLSLMSNQARYDWSTRVYERNTPEFTLENIQATFGNLLASRQEMFEQGVIDCFHACSWDHKTNSPVKFGKKLIFKGYAYNKFHTSFDSATLRKIDDVRRVLHIADGKPAPDHREGAEAAMSNGRNWLFEDDLVHVEGFKNANLHVKFKRMDLVESLNTLLAKRYPGALPAP